MYGNWLICCACVTAELIFPLWGSIKDYLILMRLKMIIKSTNRSFIFISVHLLPFLHLNWCVYAVFFLRVCDVHCHEHSGKGKTGSSRPVYLFRQHPIFFFLELMMEVAKECHISLDSYLCWELHQCSTDCLDGMDWVLTWRPAIMLHWSFSCLPLQSLFQTEICLSTAKMDGKIFICYKTVFQTALQTSTQWIASDKV